MIIPALHWNEQRAECEVEPRVGVVGLGRVLVVKCPRQLGVKSRNASGDQGSASASTSRTAPTPPHLYRVFPKLGSAARTELAAALVTDAVPEAAR